MPPHAIEAAHDPFRQPVGLVRERAPGAERPFLPPTYLRIAERDSLFDYLFPALFPFGGGWSRSKDGGDDDDGGNLGFSSWLSYLAHHHDPRWRLNPLFVALGAQLKRKLQLFRASQVTRTRFMANVDGKLSPSPCAPYRSPS